MSYRILVSAPVPFWVHLGWNWVGTGLDWVGIGSVGIRDSKVDDYGLAII